MWMGMCSRCFNVYPLASMNFAVEGTSIKNHLTGDIEPNRRVLLA